MVAYLTPGKTLLAAIVALTSVQPALACAVPLPKMTPAELAGAGVAFVGTVVSIEPREEEILEGWPDFMACPWFLKNGFEKPDCAAHPPVAAAIFRVDEPIRGVRTGDEYVVPQSGGPDCSTHYTVGTRYVFGAVGLNGKVWQVGATDTAAAAIAARSK